MAPFHSARRRCAVVPAALAVLVLLAPGAGAQTATTPTATTGTPPASAMPGVVPCAALAPEEARRLCGQTPGPGMGPGMMYGQGGPGDMPRYGVRGGDWEDDDWTASDTVMTILLTLLILVGAAAVLALWRRGHHGPHAHGPADAPLAILERRFAHGEIDAEEYARRRAALERTS